MVLTLLIALQVAVVVPQPNSRALIWESLALMRSQLAICINEDDLARQAAARRIEAMRNLSRTIGVLEASLVGSLEEVKGKKWAADGDEESPAKKRKE